jgi:C-terminal processing protease CtpA/Prc
MSRATNERIRTAGLWAVAVALITVLTLGAGAIGPRAAQDESDDDERGIFFFRSDGAFLGVSTEEETGLAEGGARVAHVVRGSPADEAGLREGDIIVELGGDVIRGPLRLRQRIVEREPGTRVKIVVMRDGERVKLTAELGDRGERGDVTWFSDIPFDEEWAEEMAERSRELAEHYGDWYREHGEELAERQREWQEQYAEEWAGRYKEWAERYRDFEPRLRFDRHFDRSRPRLGVELIETTPELREHLGGSESAGVLVSKVLAGTPAERAGVRVGDLILSVDGVEVGTHGDLIRELREKAGRTIELEVGRDGRRTTLRPELPETDEDEAGGPRASIDARRELLRAMRPALREARAARAEALREEARSQREARRELRRQLREVARGAVLREAV